LRNQTGTFASSAELLTLTRTKAKTLVGTYTYNKDPYSTFAPGGQLHTQKRDPNSLIKGAIRQLALKILKGKFPGIALKED
jgi:hypothetical protein